MARLTWTGWLGVVGLCLMLTLAVLPKTRWLVKLHGYTATGSINLSQSSSELSYDDLLQLIRPHNPANPKEELTEAILTKAVPDGDLRRSNLVKLADKYPNNPLIQAVACRYLSMLTIPRPDKNGIIQPPQYPKEHIEKRQKSFEELVKCASRGIAADPDNLYFDLILACARVGERKIDEARAVIHKALNKQSYNEYGWDECNLLRDLMKGSNNYGDYMRLQVYAGLMLPYYASMKSLSICLAQSGTEEQKRQSSIDLLLIAGTVSNKVDTLIGILVMRAITSIALASTFHRKPGEKPTQDQYMAAIDKLQPHVDARYPKGSSPSLRSIYEQSNRLAKATQRYSDENSGKVDAGDPAAFPASPFARMKLSLGILLAFFFLVPGAMMQAVGQRIRSHPRTTLALPLLVPLFVGLYMSKFNLYPSSLEYGWIAGVSWWVLVAAFILSWEPRLAKASFWITIAVGSVGVLFSIYALLLGFSPFSMPFFLSAAAATSVFSSQDKGPEWLRSTIGAVLLITAVSAASMNLALSCINSTEWFLAFLMILLAACIGPIRPNSGRRVVGPVLLVLAAVFALHCKQMAAIDQQAGQMTKTFMTEVQQVREMAAKMP